MAPIWRANHRQLPNMVQRLTSKNKNALYFRAFFISRPLHNPPEAQQTMFQ